MMGTHTWATDAVACAQRWEGVQRAGSESIVWAWFTADSLHYLDDVDRQTQASFPARTTDGHNAHVVDIAHVRWATATAVTALDLCAAALGAAYCNAAGPRLFDLRSFDLRVDPTAASRRRASLPSAFVGWVDGVLSDPAYVSLQPARNRLTHAWMTRDLTGGSNSRRGRFRIANGPSLGAREIVELATSLGTRGCEAFFAVVMTTP